MKNDSHRKLGTFLGVFTPTILTILGVIMYLRTGWLTGHLGLYQVLLIVVIANLITLITTLSFSSVATNVRLGVGGAYYIISRSLGLEIGGAIGVPLYLAQTLSVTLYSFGFAESLKLVWPDLNIQVVAFAVIVIVGILAYVGAKHALQTQLPIMGMVALSLIALIIGTLTNVKSRGAIMFEPSGEIEFWVGFAIFFPAVTGIMAGLSLSGDLKNPGRSIPLGALIAVITGFVIYLTIPVLLAFGTTQENLQNNYLIWFQIAPFGPWLILPGLFGAIFSSAVGSMLGAPRTLQALSIDGTAPRKFGRFTGKISDLLPGMLLTVLIASAAVLLGDLNKVAPVVTMFFLTTYGMINLAAAIENISGDPSWRPKIKIPWFINIIGVFGCVGAIFLINPVAGIIAVIIELALWMYLSKRGYQARWGDARRGMYETLIRWALIRLFRRPVSARNWRPHFLIFVTDTEKEINLIRFGNLFSQSRGVVTVCHLIVGDLMKLDIDLNQIKSDMNKTIESHGLLAFPDVNIVNDVENGILNVTQANGIAGMESNCVIVGLPKSKTKLAEILKVMRQLEKLKTSFILARTELYNHIANYSNANTVLIWWGGLQRNGDLMMLLAYLLTRNPHWKHAKIKVMSIASTEMMKVETEEYLKKLIPEVRIDADFEVIVKPQGKNVKDLILEKSQDASVVLFGLAIPEEGKELEYAERIEEMAGDLPTVFFVKNSSLFIGELLKPGSEPDQDIIEPDDEESDVHEQ